MFINIGAYVDEGSMVDSHALVGSCAQIGKRVHLSAAAQVGGVLEAPGALHVAFSDGRTVFVISAADGGATWKDPAAVNNPGDPDTKIGTSPWILAGMLRQIAGARLIFGPFMTAAGFVKTETGERRVSFNVRQDFSGSLTYLDEQRKLSLRSMQFTSSKRIDQKIAISGRGRLHDGSEVTFTLVAADPNTKDKDFSISMSNGYFAAGSLEDARPADFKAQVGAVHFSSSGGESPSGSGSLVTNTLSTRLPSISTTSNR